MSSNKKDEDQMNDPIPETKKSSKIKVHKDPLFNIGDIVKHRIYPFNEWINSMFNYISNIK